MNECVITTYMYVLMCVCAYVCVILLISNNPPN